MAGIVEAEALALEFLLAEGDAQEVVAIAHAGIEELLDLTVHLSDLAVGGIEGGEVVLDGGYLPEVLGDFLLELAGLEAELELADIALDGGEAVGGGDAASGIDGLHDAEGGGVGAVELADGVGLAGIGCKSGADGCDLGGDGAVALDNLVEGVEGGEVGGDLGVVFCAGFIGLEAGGIDGEGGVLQGAVVVQGAVKALL